MAWEFKCVCGRKYQEGEVPEECACGNMIAKASALGHRMWAEEGPTGHRCHDCGGVIVSTAFGWTGQMSMFECTGCGKWSYRLWDIAFDKKAFIEELEESIRWHAKTAGEEWPGLSEDRKSFTFGPRTFCTPATLGRIAYESLTITGISDFIKMGIGKRRWPTELARPLLGPFDRIIQQITAGTLLHEEGLKIAKRLAMVVEPEFVYAASKRRD